MQKETLSWFGHEYPIIAPLPEFPGWHLIAHPNGPAICDGDNLSVLYTHGGDTEDAIRIKAAAQIAYIQHTWPHIKPQFFPEDS